MEGGRERWALSLNPARRVRDQAAAAGGLDALEAALRECGGRPHWGKLHAAPDARLAAELPGWAAFCALSA